MKRSSLSTLKRFQFALLASLLVSTVIVGMGEIFARFCVPPYKKYHLIYYPPQLSELFRFDRYLGWSGIPGIRSQCRGDRVVAVKHNAQGFRDVEHGIEKYRPRWAFLGDSFVYGYDCEVQERFTDLIAARSAAEILNCGVCGYGTQQELLLYRHRLRKYKPDLVVLLFGANDRAENRKPVSTAGYAVPYFVLGPGGLVQTSPTVPELLHAESGARPVLPWYRPHLWDYLRYRMDRLRRFVDPDPTQALVTALKRSVEADGARFVVAIEKADKRVLECCRTMGTPVIELGPAIQAASAHSATNFAGNGGHWTPFGQKIAAEAISKFIASLPAKDRK
jgi:hypothetical protein